jgi:hypothetical protein
MSRHISLFHPLCFVVLNRPSNLVAVADMVAVATTTGPVAAVERKAV